jgi:hypothetical protein
MFRWLRSRRPPLPEDEIVASIAPATRQHYRDLDRAAILARIDRFSLTAVEGAWAQVCERRKRRPELAPSDPFLERLARESCLAVVNFARHQLSDPHLRRERLLAALEQQERRWQELAAAGDATDQVVLGHARDEIARQRARLLAEPPG